MTAIKDLGILLEQISHDMKNHLGILETLIQDLRHGYSIDQSSLEDSLATIEKINLLGSTIQKCGVICRKTDSGGDFSSYTTALHILESALILKNNNYKNENYNYQLIIKTSKTEDEVSIPLRGDSGTPGDIEALFTNPPNTSSIRTLMSIFKLILKISGSTDCSLYLRENSAPSTLLLSCKVDMES